MRPLGKTLALLLVAFFLASLLFMPSLTVKASTDPTQVQTTAATWSKTYGSGGAYDVIQTSDGGYAVIGTCATSTGNYWLVKLDAEGNVQWNQSSCSYFDAFPKSFVETSDGGYAVVGTGAMSGSSINGVLLVKTDKYGDIQWEKEYSDTTGTVEGNWVIQTSDGGYAIVGDYARYSGPGGWDFLFIKTDAAGNQQWMKTFQGPDKQDDDRAECIVQTTDGGYALTGSTSIPGNTPIYWLLKTDSSGVPQWNKTYSESIWDWPYSVTQTSDGGYALGGIAYSEFSSNGTLSDGSFWLVKTDSTGNMQWNKNYGTNTQWVSCVIQTSDGGYSMAGEDKDFQLVKTDAQGNLQWTYAGGGERVGNAVIQSKDGGLLVAGQYNVNPTLTTCKMYYWVAKISADGSGASPDSSPTPEPSATPMPSPSPGSKASFWLSCQSSTSTNIRVNIKGTLTVDGIGISDASILFSYSVDNGLHWNELTSVNSGDDGSFNVLWTPSATGNYLLNATWTGNSIYPAASTIFNVAITPCNSQGFFSVTTNSTLSELSFDSAAKQLSFTVSGPEGTTGYLEISIPKSLIADIKGLTVNLDGSPIAYTSQSAGDSWLVSFSYHHSTHKIVLELNSSAASTGILLAQQWIVYLVVASAAALVIVAALVARKIRTS